MVNRDAEAEKLLLEVESVIEKLDEMNKKYGNDWLDKLPSFNGSTLLKEYQKKVCHIERFSLSKITIDEMTHLLYHIMSQHLFSFCNVENTLKGRTGANEETPLNLSGSYGLSVEIAKKLNNDSKSYAWFSNMKLPLTYINSSSVHDHYKELSKVLADLPLVKVRRLHLFYESLTHNPEQLQALFTTLFVEFLMGIDSKIVLVKDVRYPLYKDYFYDFHNQVTYGKGYLLDFALYHNEMRGYNGVYNKNYQSLFANFSYEKPDQNEHRSIQDEVEEYELQKTYLINDYNIFQILRCYFISLWEKNDYVKYLKEKQMFTPELSGIAKVYDRYLEVLDIREFWSRYLIAKSTTSFFNSKIFAFLYYIDFENNTSERFKDYVEKYRCYNKQYSNVRAADLVVKNIINEITELIDSIRDINEVKDLKEYFKKFVLRDEQDELRDELIEIYRLYTKEQSEDSFREILKKFISENKIM